MSQPTNYARYQPGHEDASLKPALWCLDCTEDGNYQADVRLIWVQPAQETIEPTLADLNAIADEHEVKRHATGATGAEEGSDAAPHRVTVTTGRCAHCGRRLRNSVQSILHADGDATAFCGQRAECRRACDEQLGGHRVNGASTEAFGAALIAADYVAWPWWGRLIPGAARDTMRSRFARAMSAAAEQRGAYRSTTDDEGGSQ